MPATNFNTVIKNVSGQTRFFGYLGQLGTRLANNQTYEHPGLLIQQTAHGSTAQASVANAAIRRDLAAGVIKIIRTPDVILQDADSSQPRVLHLDDGDLGTVAPSY